MQSIKNEKTSYEDYSKYWSNIKNAIIKGYSNRININYNKNGETIKLKIYKYSRANFFP